MTKKLLRVITHGGAGSKTIYKDGTDGAAHAAMEALQRGKGVMEAAIRGTEVLEDDPRFNAGTGSSIRLDGGTIQMDAACMDSQNNLGAVSLIERVRHPIRVAQKVLDTPHILMAGDGAIRFARNLGFEDYDPVSPQAREKYERVLGILKAQALDTPYEGWTRETIAQHWNFDIPIDEVFSTGDTVGCVATDGEHFAATLSSGGGPMCLRGRVGDVPLPGCGLWAGPHGAVAVTGDGEFIAKEFLANHVYNWLETGMDAQAASDKALTLFPEGIDIGLIVVGKKGVGGCSNREMPWSVLEGEA